MMKSKTALFGLLVVTTLIYAACSSTPATPEPAPTLAEPTAEPTAAEPTAEPTVEPTAEPTAEPSTEVTSTVEVTDTATVTSTETQTDTSSVPAVINATFVCPDGTSIPVVFDNTAGTATVTLPDGEVTLPQAVSASGARYSDDTTTIWNKGNSLLVEVNGETIYQDCVTTDTPVDSSETVTATESMTSTEPITSTETQTTTTEAADVIDATFVCPDGTSIPVVFDNAASTATVTLPDGEVTLPQVVAASGARYSDDTTTIWNNGNSLLVEVNGETVYQDCVTQ